MTGDAKAALLHNPAAVARLGRWVTFVGVVLAAVLVACWWAVVLAPRERLVLFFDSSVHGISIGAPVKIQGNTIGQVAALDVRVPQGESSGFYATVRVVLDAKLLENKGFPENLASRRVLDGEIARGLRGKMALTSPMTGDYHIELSYLPEMPPVLVSAPQEALSEIPVVPKMISEQKLDTYASWLEHFSGYDFLELERNWNTALDFLLEQTLPEKIKALNVASLAWLKEACALLGDPQLRTDSRDINEKLVHLRTALESPGEVTALRLAEWAETLAGIRQALVRVRGKVEAFRALSGADSASLRSLYSLPVRVRAALDTVLPYLQLTLPGSPGIPGDLSPDGQTGE